MAPFPPGIESRSLGPAQARPRDDNIECVIPSRSPERLPRAQRGGARGSEGHREGSASPPRPGGSRQQADPSARHRPLDDTLVAGPRDDIPHVVCHPERLPRAQRGGARDLLFSWGASWQWQHKQIPWPKTGLGMTTWLQGLGMTSHVWSVIPSGPSGARGSEGSAFPPRPGGSRQQADPSARDRPRDDNIECVIPSACAEPSEGQRGHPLSRRALVGQGHKQIPRPDTALGMTDHGPASG